MKFNEYTNAVVNNKVCVALCELNILLFIHLNHSMFVSNSLL